MPAFENITDKIVLLLSKTKDALLQDLEKEFSSVREALEKAPLFRSLRSVFPGKELL